VNVCQPESLPFYPDYKQAISQRDMLSNQIKDIKRKIIELQTSLEAIDAEMKTLLKQNADNKTQITNLTNVNRKLCNNPREMSKCRLNRTQISQLQNTINANEKKLTDAKKKKSDIEKSLTEYNQQYTKLDSSRLETIAQINNFEKRIEEACKPPVISGEVGFRMATWECHDETQARYKDMHSCTDVQTWKSFSEVSCQNKCSRETGKCGVTRLVYNEKCDIQTPSVCGNGIREGSEQCDDGNTVSKDGCSDICKIENKTGLVSFGV
jgi:cysteine-rich repeat protein